MNNCLHAALTYAELGWQVVPLNVPTASGCSCRRGAACPSPGKHPWVKWKDSGGSTDPEFLRWCWRKKPASGVAVLTGTARSGLFVLDVDQDGQAVLDGLQHLHRPLPDTLQAVTGSGGRHLMFSVTGPSPTDAGQLGHRLDRRGDGGLAAFAPSPHRSGRHYQWSNWGHPVAVAPAWILKTRAPARTISPGERVAAMHASGDELLDQAVRLVAGAAEGTRHHTIVRAAWAVAALVVAGRLDEHTARAQLLYAADRCGLDRWDAEAAIDTAITKRTAA